MIATKVVNITVPRTSLEKALTERSDPDRAPGNYCIISPIGRIACEGREIILPAEQELITWVISDLTEGHFAGILFGREGSDGDAVIRPNPDLSVVLAIPNPQVSYPALTRLDDSIKVQLEDERQPDIELTTDLMMGNSGYNMDTLVARAEERGFKYTGWGNPGVKAFLDITSGGAMSSIEQQRRAGQKHHL